MDNTSIERNSLEVGKWGNLFMGVAGVVASVLSHSDALLIDGLYSGVNFVAAIVAARISTLTAKPADRRYPFGYDAHESLYVTFRSLVLLGIIAFAVFSGIEKIVTYATGGEVAELVFGPILIYTVVMVAICSGLAYWHRYNWQRTGQQSELLSTESKAAVVDAIVSAGAGGGLLGALLLRGTPLEGIVPVSDSIVVLIMCACIVPQPLRLFLGSLGEVAGKSADTATVDKVRTRAEELFRDRPYVVLEVAVTKLGRAHFILAYIKPSSPITGSEADKLWNEIKQALTMLLGSAKVEIVIAGQGPFTES